MHSGQHWLGSYRVVPALWLRSRHSLFSLNAFVCTIGLRAFILDSVTYHVSNQSTRFLVLQPPRTLFVVLNVRIEYADENYEILQLHIQACFLLCAQSPLGTYFRTVQFFG